MEPLEKSKTESFEYNRLARTLQPEARPRSPRYIDVDVDDVETANQLDFLERDRRLEACHIDK